MQLSLSFSAVLAGVLFMFSIQGVDSAPLTQRAPKGVTLPLKRVEIGSRNIHGQIYLQQHMNRAHRRFARMTGREEPTERELHALLEKRILAVEGPQGLEKRYNRIGVPKKSGVQKSGAAKKAAGAAKKVAGAASLAAQAKGNNGKGKAKGKLANGKDSPTETDPTATADTSAAAAAAGAQAANVVSPVTNANPPADTDSLGLNIEAQDVGYLATVQMGTPPQNFQILMDSGSADFWVGAENCQSQAGGGCGTHTFLGPQSSSTFVDTQNPFSVTYGTGSVSGDIITDNVNIAGLALQKHTFGVATTESVDFSSDSTPFDGLMGLAKSTLSEQQTLTPVESLAQAGLIPSPITSFKISRLADNLNDGEITFGSLDTSKFDSATLTTLPNVNADGFWEADLAAVSVNGNDLGLQGRTAILDTGTTLMVVPASDATTIHNSIQGAQADGQGGFTVPCTLTDSVALTFGNQVFAIDPRDIAFQPVDPNNPQGDCVSGITSGNIGGATEWLVGDVFLKNAYFSTDVNKNTVSLAKLV